MSRNRFELTPERWARARALFDQALRVPVAERAAYLARHCGSDPLLYQAVESLLEADAAAGGILDASLGTLSLLLPDGQADLELRPGDPVARYRVVRDLGRGGMGVVYLAEDPRLERLVALKFLPAGAASDPGRVDQLMAEARALAALDHPNIATVYEVDATPEGRWFIAMAYYEGETLAQRLSRGSPSRAEALQIAIGIARGLSAAHRRGVIHRDVKPGNVMLPKDGEVKLVDFGLASLPGRGDGSSRTARGTVAYMSPEQVRGAAADARADVWALGVVLYEMLVGRRPFEGETTDEVLAQIQAAALAPLPSSVGRGLARVIRRALARDPAARFADAGQMLRYLERCARPRRRARWVTAGVAAAALVAVWLWSSAQPNIVLGRSERLTSEPGLEIQPAISPNARFVAYAAGTSAATRIFLRAVAGGRPFPLSEDSTIVEWQPHWSPDGTQVLFLTATGAWVSPALGGTSRRVIPTAPTAGVESVTWSPDGREIAFVRGDSLLVVPVQGAGIRLVARTMDGTHSCAWSPNGKWIACVVFNPDATRLGYAFGNLAPSAIDLFPAVGGTPVRVAQPTSFNQSPAWTPTGRLLFISNRDGLRDVYALDLSASGKVRGPPIRITTGLGAYSISLSADGSRLAYAVYSTRANIWSLPIPARPPVTIADARPVTSGSQVIEGLRVSWDKRWLLYDSNLHGNSDIYRIRLPDGQPEQLTNDPADEFEPDLSPDGTLLAYHSWRSGTRDIELKPLNGGPVQRLTDSPAQESNPRWFANGQAIAFLDQDPPRGLSVWHRTDGGGWSPPITLATHVAVFSLSPDGRWAAFTTQNLKDQHGNILIVSSSGGQPRQVLAHSSGAPIPHWVEWSPDGSTLYYKAHDDTQGRSSFWAVDATGGTPRLLVRFPDPDRQSNRAEFTTDGERFYFAIEDRQADVWVANLIRK